jgi:hypothetical protein
MSGPVDRNDMISLRGVRLRDTHPNLYRSLMTVALIFVALGFNFLLTTPTFQQYDIPKNYIGTGFLALGLGNLLFLNLRRNLKAVRMLLIVGIAYMLFWGVGTTQTFFEGTSSLQLCILYFGLAALQAPLLLEPFFNPVTANGLEEE